MVWLFIPVIIQIKTLKNSDVLHKSKEDGQSAFSLWSQIFINEDEGIIHFENSQKKYALACVCPCRAGETLELFVLIMWRLSFKVRDIKVFVVEALKDLFSARQFDTSSESPGGANDINHDFKDEANIGVMNYTCASPAPPRQIACCLKGLLHFSQRINLIRNVDRVSSRLIRYGIRFRKGRLCVDVHFQHRQFWNGDIHI